MIGVATVSRFTPVTLVLPALLAAAIAAAALSGCAELLPKSQTEVQSPWHAFDEARAAMERIVPYRTTKDELTAAGIDP